MSTGEFKMDRDKPADQPRYDMATVREIIRAASLRSSESNDTISREELEAISAECGIAPAALAGAIAEIGHTHAPLSTGWFGRLTQRQRPAIIAGAAVGGASAIIAGGIGVLVAPAVAAFAGISAMLAVAVAEGAFACRIRGSVKHATFQAVNLATWGGWATACAVLGQPEMGSIAIAASAASAVMGSALIAARSGSAGSIPSQPAHVSDREGHHEHLIAGPCV